MEMKSND
jgi:hypothetical protein